MEVSRHERHIASDDAHEDHISRLEGIEADSTFWSGIGQKYDVLYDNVGTELQEQLMNGTPLGEGASGTVQLVMCRGVTLARKSIRTPTSANLNAVKAEIEAIRNLAGHQHIVRLVGTYLSTEHGHTMYHILTFPVADCDMNTFLNDCEAWYRGTSLEIQRLTKVLKLDVFTDMLRLLKQSLGCITAGIKWIHGPYILQTLVSRGIDAMQKGHLLRQILASHGWSAPEREGERHNPFRSDVYSLGCIFIHVITVISSKKTRRDCSDIIRSPPQHRERYIQDHFSAVGLQPWTECDGISTYDLIGLTTEMLRNDRHSRPSIWDVDERLRAVDGLPDTFYGACCRNSTPTDQSEETHFENPENLSSQPQQPVLPYLPTPPTEAEVNLLSPNPGTLQTWQDDGEDTTVRLWDAATGAARQTIKGHSGVVSSVAFSPDGRVVASASWDMTVRLWEAATGAARQTLEGHSGAVSSVAFSPDGRVVASASYDETVRLWDAATGAARQTLEGHSDRATSVAFSPDGRVVASASEDRTVGLWKAATGAARQTPEGHLTWVAPAAYHLCGDRFSLKHESLAGLARPCAAGRGRFP